MGSFIARSYSVVLIAYRVKLQFDLKIQNEITQKIRSQVGAQAKTKIDAALKA